MQSDIRGQIAMNLAEAPPTSNADVANARRSERLSPVPFQLNERAELVENVNMDEDLANNNIPSDVDVFNVQGPVGLDEESLSG